MTLLTHPRAARIEFGQAMTALGLMLLSLDEGRVRDAASYHRSALGSLRAAALDALGVSRGLPRLGAP
jgi:hypothetical protein